MNRTTLLLAAAAVLSAGAARAQDNAPVQPTTPAPAVVQAPTNVAPAPINATQVVYSPKLPTAEELTNAASAQGYTIEKIVQTANQVVAFYRNASGQPITVAYQSLPPAGTATAPAAAPVQVTSPTPAPVVVTAPPTTTVVYETAPRVIYYDDPYYYPRYYYPPVSLHLGFGYSRYYGGHYGGHFGGGHHFRR